MDKLISKTMPNKLVLVFVLIIIANAMFFSPSISVTRPTIIITADPVDLCKGNSAKLSWEVKDFISTEYYIESNFANGVIKGEKTVKPEKDEQYFIKVYSNDNTFNSFYGAMIFVNNCVDSTGSKNFKIIGDVNSGKDALNLSLDAKSVISASGTIDQSVSGSTWKLPSYNASSFLSWNSILERMTRIINRMLAEYSTNITNPSELAGGVIYLNNGNTASFRVQPPAPYVNVKPEGKVWYVENQDVNVNSSDLIVNGIGTIIIKNGNLNIDKNISYTDSSTKNSIGFIVLKGTNDNSGNITVGSGVNKLRGAYYAPDGRITFK